MWQQIQSNKRKTVFILAVLALVLVATGYALGELIAPGFGLFGILLAWFIWLFQAIISYYTGDRIFLSLSRARRIKREDHPVLYNVVEEMKIASGLSHMPEIYVIDDDAPNAFATGRDPEHASVAVTTGLLQRLTRDELQGVIGHELGHINNRDILLMTMAGVMLGTIVLLSDMGFRMLRHGGCRRTSNDRDSGGAVLILFLLALFFMIISPLLAHLLYYALSRRREYLADACSALYTRYPQGLASALQKIAQFNQPLRYANRTTAPMFIVNPLTSADLTSTHPPTSERIEILMAMASMGADYQSYNEAYRQVTGRPVGVIPFTDIKGTDHVDMVEPSVTDTQSHQERVRQTTDMMWRLNRYRFIHCNCGTRLKVPPQYQDEQIACPHCGLTHAIA